MPAAEAEGLDEQEIAVYELAFHVLPTVAEGEVANVFQSLKDTITKAKGEVVGEEAPERFDLAYEIIKYLEGRNRKFTSAYFGWIRFRVHPDFISAISEEVDGKNELLRHLLIRLTRSEEENPFLFHEALAETKVDDIEVDEEVKEKSAKPEVDAEKKTDGEEEKKEV